MGTGWEKPVPERTAEVKKINHKCLSKSQWRFILGENLGEERQCDRMSQVKNGVIEGETGNSGSKRKQDAGSHPRPCSTLEFRFLVSGTKKHSVSISKY